MTTLPERWPPGAGGRPPADDPRRPAALWADGSFRLRITDPPGGPARELLVDRPFALIGRRPGADLRIDDRAVGARHLYLHLDGRGLFAVDLATRTGTRFDGRERPSGWLHPGQALEIAGRRIELLECHVRAADADDDADADDADDLLADAGAAPLARVTLYPTLPGAGTRGPSARSWSSSAGGPAAASGSRGRRRGPTASWSGAADPPTSSTSPAATPCSTAARSPAPAASTTATS